MKTSIVYFSRTQKTKKTAEKLAKMTAADLYQITDDKNWKGVLGYIKAGYYASADKKIIIHYDPACLEADQLILMSPLWAGGPSPAVRAFIRAHSSKSMTLVLTNDGSSINKAFERVKVMFPQITKLYGITKSKQNEEEMLNQIKKDL